MLSYIAINIDCNIMPDLSRSIGVSESKTPRCKHNGAVSGGIQGFEVGLDVLCDTIPISCGSPG